MVVGGGERYFTRNHNKGDVSLSSADSLNSIQTTPLHLARACVCVRVCAVAKTRLETFLDLAHVRRN